MKGRETHGVPQRRKPGRPKIRKEAFDRFTVAVPVRINQAVRDLCEERGISVSAYLCALVERDLIARGRIKEQAIAAK